MKKKPSLQINVQNVSHTKNIPSKSQFEYWALTTMEFAKKNISTEITIRIVTANESKKLNNYYRNKNKPTNVLSFPFIAHPGVKINYLGDIVICAAVVRSEAKTQKKTFIAHWAHMTTHGVLHLLGYDHIKNKDADEMENLENMIMKNLGYCNNLHDCLPC